MNHLDEAYEVVKPYIRDRDKFKTDLRNLLDSWSASPRPAEYNKPTENNTPDINEARRIKKFLAKASPATKSRLNGGLGGSLTDKLLQEIESWESIVENNKHPGNPSKKNIPRVNFEERCEHLFFRYNKVLADPALDKQIKEISKQHGKEFEHINQNEFAKFLMHCLLYVGFEKENAGNSIDEEQCLDRVRTAYKRRIERN